MTQRWRDLLKFAAMMRARALSTGRPVRWPRPEYDPDGAWFPLRLWS